LWQGADLANGFGRYGTSIINAPKEPLTELLAAVTASIANEPRCDMLVKLAAAEKPVRFVLDERLDFNHFVPLRKSYIVASSYRSGSNYLCWEFWRTGVLGAPVEFLNPYDALPVFMNRFKASSPADYIVKLIEHRSSKNGVFGLKTHSHHFEAFLKQYPGLLKALAPVTFIHINRRNKLAQAVSMAKALQTDFWTSRIESERPPPQYDRGLIEKCLVEVEQQELRWPRWFEANNITPFRVLYEDLIAATPKVVRSILELLGVENDEPDEVQVPPTSRQGDAINREWIERFDKETSGERQQTQVAEGAICIIGTEVPQEESVDPRRGASPPRASHFFDRYKQFIRQLPVAPDTATGFVGLIRSRHRYEAIVARNRDLFCGARVLDMMGGDGLWSLAALDAGAVHVIRVDLSPFSAETANQTFTEYGFKPEAYQIVNAKAWRNFDPETFDLILCQGILEKSDPRLFFGELQRLRPKHVIVDTEMVRGKGPIARFRLAPSLQPVAEVAGRYATIVASPSHELIMFLCEHFDYQWRRIDWYGMGITNWIGIHDYERDERRTYVLVPAPSVAE
jgi:LPS sulfotransferase NodH/2-polyprenyl-3-methyl-5-hydroxy-6-metoxy-1,4-benzoquinol methylase